MDFDNVRAVAAKDFETFKKRRSIVFYIVGLPLLLAVLFSLVIRNQADQIASRGGSTAMIPLGLEFLIYFFVVIAGILPTSIAAYSIIGEKTEKSLEPLLATPMTDGEILLGKALASFVPPILGIWLGGSVFMGLTDYFTYTKLSAYFLPNWSSAVTLFLLAPLASMLGIQIAVIISSRVNDVRGANQLGGLVFIPLVLVFVSAVTGEITLDLATLLAMAFIFLGVDIGLYFLSARIFQREEILTKWK